MKQVVQSYRTGKISLEEVPVPLCQPGGLLIQTACSLVSIGTERSIIQLGRKSLLGKAVSRPDLVKRALAKARNEGYWKTFQEALGRLDIPTALGYSAAGTVIGVGAGVDEFRVGEKVACIGAGFASHAEFINIPKNLCVKVPEKVSFEEAAFGMLGIIALHGVRLAEVNLGSRVAVIGLGLLGLLTVQLLKASGCNVFAYDVDPAKEDSAKLLGADAVITGAMPSARVSQGEGFDAVIITASAQDSKPMELAADLCRVRGKVILVGVAKIEIPRQIFWEKEIEFQVSKAGGPGSLDPSYELDGVDYPYPYVRWTEQRNLEAFLDLISQGHVVIDPLITQRFQIADAISAYEMLMKPGSGGAIGVLLTYQETLSSNQSRVVIATKRKTFSPKNGEIQVGVIGAGLFAKALLLPALVKTSGIHLKGIATANGVTANHASQKYGFEYNTTDYRTLLDDKNIDAVMVLTRHSLHAKIVQEALDAGKHVFVEKPLCVDESELVQIVETYKRIENSLVLCVGYNRRFSPSAIRLQSCFSNHQEPLVMSFRVNVGILPNEHWVNHSTEGGGRIVGELCHFVDLAQYFAGSLPSEVFAHSVSSANQTRSSRDDISVHIKFDDGSIAAIVYTASGDRAFSRERMEIFSQGSVGVLEDFRTMSFVANGKTKVERWRNQDLGYLAELDAFFLAVRNGQGPHIPIEHSISSSLATFRILESLTTGQSLIMGEPGFRAQGPIISSANANSSFN